jgi:hypothetical protein
LAISSVGSRSRLSKVALVIPMTRSAAVRDGKNASRKRLIRQVPDHQKAQQELVKINVAIPLSKVAKRR